MQAAHFFSVLLWANKFFAGMEKNVKVLCWHGKGGGNEVARRRVAAVLFSSENEQQQRLGSVAKDLQRRRVAQSWWGVRRTLLWGLSAFSGWFPSFVGAAAATATVAAASAAATAAAATAAVVINSSQHYHCSCECYCCCYCCNCCCCCCCCYVSSLSFVACHALLMSFGILHLHFIFIHISFSCFFIKWHRLNNFNGFEMHLKRTAGKDFPLNLLLRKSESIKDRLINQNICLPYILLQLLKDYLSQI